jgi:hypothetical protein
MRELNEPAPTIEEMRSALAKPISVDFPPLVPHELSCSICGTTKAPYWIIINGVSTCDVCGSEDNRKGAA